MRALLPNPEMKLRPGMLLKVTIERGERAVLQVPEEALIPVGEDQFVFRVASQGVDSQGVDSQGIASQGINSQGVGSQGIDRQGIAERVQVQIGRRRVGAVEITAGLEAGDHVVVEGIVRVRHGAPVQVVKVLAKF